MTSPNTGPSELSILTDMVRNLTMQVGEIRERHSAPPPVEERVYTAEELRENPQLVMEGIKRHLDSSIAPIQQFRVQMERNSKYQQIKERIRTSQPHIEKLWDKIVGQLDTAIENSNVDPTMEVVSYHVSALMGSYLMRNPTALSDVAPPSMHLPPSGSPPAPNSQTPPVRTLTANEETLRQQRGWTVEQYLKNSEEGAFTVTRKVEEKK